MKPEPKKKRGSPEGIEGLTGLLRRWQSIGDHSVASTNRVFFVERHLLTYLVEDEQLHDCLLGQLEDFERKIYPCA